MGGHEKRLNKISIMGVYERVGIKNGSIMMSIMLCFFFYLISSISQINVTISVS